MKLPAVVRSALTSHRDAAQDAADGVAGVRARLAAAKGRRRDLENAERPLEEAIALADAEVDRLAAIGRNGLVTLGLTSHDPRQYGLGPGLHLKSELSHLPALLAMVGGDALKAGLRVRLAAQYAGKPGIAAHDRETQLKATDAEILDLELLDEAMVRASELSGLAVHRRADADPRAVLAPDSALPQ